MRELVEWAEEMGYIVVEFEFWTNRSGRISLRVTFYKNRGRHTFYI